MDSRGASANPYAEKTEIRDLNNQVLVLQLITRDGTDFAASFEVSSLSVPRLLRFGKVFLCYSDVALVQMFKQRSEKRKENKIFSPCLKSRNAQFFVGWAQNNIVDLSILPFAFICCMTETFVLITYSILL